MHMLVIYVGAPNVTGEEKIFRPDPAEDRTRDPPHVKRILYHVTIKAGLYRKAVLVCYIPIPCDTYVTQASVGFLFKQSRNFDIIDIV